jgi:hypothetical protein
MEVLMGKPWENHRKMEVYPLVNIQKAIEKWPSRNSGFTDLPSYKMVMFHSFLYVYQRVERNVDLPMTH